jgi:hypothetical protein
VIVVTRGFVSIPAVLLLLAIGSVAFGADDSKQSLTPAVAIQVGPEPTEVERYAAKELARYLDKLFHIKTHLSADFGSAQNRADDFARGQSAEQSGG